MHLITEMRAWLTDCEQRGAEHAPSSSVVYAVERMCHDGVRGFLHGEGIHPHSATARLFIEHFAFDIRRAREHAAYAAR